MTGWLVIGMDGCLVALPCSALSPGPVLLSDSFHLWLSVPLHLPRKVGDRDCNWNGNRVSDIRINQFIDYLIGRCLGNQSCSSRIKIHAPIDHRETAMKGFVRILNTPNLDQFPELPGIWKPANNPSTPTSRCTSSATHLCARRVVVRCGGGAKEERPKRTAKLNTLELPFITSWTHSLQSEAQDATTVLSVCIH